MRTYGTGRVYQRGKTWYVAFTHNGRRLSRLIPGCESKIEANRRATEVIQNYSGKIFDSSRITIAELNEIYLDSNLERIIEKSRKNRQRMIDIFQKEFNLVSAMNSETLGRFRQRWKNTPTQHGRVRANRTVNIEFGYIQTMCNWAFKNGKIGYNSFRGFNPLKVAKSTKRRHLSPEERERLLAALQLPDFTMIRPIVLIALRMGFRQYEIFSMKWEQIKNGFIYIPAATAKSNRDREVPIPKNIIPVLDSIERNSDVYLFPSWKFGVYQRMIFNPDKHITTIKKRYKSLLKQAEIEDFDFHALRHSAITQWLNVNAVPVTVVRDWAGHSDIKTTMLYLHTDKAVSKGWMDSC